MKRTSLLYASLLLTALIAAAVGLSLRARIRWLAAALGLMAAAHILGLASLIYGLSWLDRAASPGYATDLAISLFAGFWSLFPFVVGGVWAWRYWQPRSSAREQVAPSADGDAAS